MKDHYYRNCTLEALILFVIGGFAYNIIELLFRGYTYPSMFVLGGICFLLIGNLNEGYQWDTPITSQMVLSALIVTVLEFLFGCFLNLFIGAGIWDYSDMPYNLCGQVCLLFSCAWFFLSAIAIIVDDLIRWKLFRGRKPHYHIFYNCFCALKKDLSDKD